MKERKEMKRKVVAWRKGEKGGTERGKGGGQRGRNTKPSSIPELCCLAGLCALGLTSFRPSVLHKLTHHHVLGLSCFSVHS